MFISSKVLRKLRHNTKSYAHHFVGAVIVIAHASEIGRVASHLKWQHVLLALVVFGAWFATKSHGHENEELA
ncbi:hypothetical protein IPM19_00200 [bacterium]|nr:MAG: hypothetical protein IPM19_00200 [bacterium]